MIRIVLIAAFVSVWTSAAEAYTYPCTTAAPVCVITSAPSSGTTTLINTYGYYTYVWNYTASGSNTLILEDCTTFTTAPTIVFKDLNGGAGHFRSNPIALEHRNRFRYASHESILLPNIYIAMVCYCAAAAEAWSAKACERLRRTL